MIRECDIKGCENKSTIGIHNKSMRLFRLCPVCFKKYLNIDKLESLIKQKNKTLALKHYYKTLK